ncbi:MAG: hypothetical protein IKR74_01955 [Bacilli bacterium]|nr:hypothetical protein [Bacilli bacterium]
MKKRLMIIIILSIIVIFSILMIIKRKYDKKPTINNSSSGYESKFIKTCLDENSPRCTSFDKEYIFLKSYTDDSNLIKDKVESINKSTADNYNISLKSNNKDSACASKKDLYSHRYIFDSKVSRFDNDKVTILFASWDKTDLCTDNTSNVDSLVYYYDKKAQKFINYNDVVNILDLKSFSVVKKIKANINEINKYGKSYKYENVTSVKVFITYDGFLSIYYLQKEDNHSFIINTDTTLK